MKFDSVTDGQSFICKHVQSSFGPLHVLGHAKHVWNLQIVCLPKPPTERARLAVGLQESHACRCLRVLRWQLAAVG